jgi:hypothetical protein
MREGEQWHLDLRENWIIDQDRTSLSFECRSNPVGFMSPMNNILTVMCGDC